jgi:hypothetical protein
LPRTLRFSELRDQPLTRGRNYGRNTSAKTIINKNCPAATVLI